MFSVVYFIVALVLALFGGALYLKRRQVRKKHIVAANGKVKTGKIFFVFAVFLWYFAFGYLLMSFGIQAPAMHIEVVPEELTIPLIGVVADESVLVGLCITVLILVLSLLFRYLAFPRFKEQPGKAQSMVETAVQYTERYVDGTVGDSFKHIGLAPYVFSLGFYLILCSVVETIGFPSPAANLSMTASLALISFVQINYYAIKKKGVFKRIKSFGHPTPVVAPMKVLSDAMTPVSLACRLFGNILGGAVVMALLYGALGVFSVGPPAVLGLFFSVFHPLIQAFIFITLTLNFINEAIE